VRLPFAEYRYVARMDNGPRENFRAVVLHTNGGKVGASGDLFNWWADIDGNGIPKKGVGAHIQITWEGKAFQYLDTDRFTGHAWDANHWTVGIETEDAGDPSIPWTPAQIDTILRILRILKVPPQLLKEGRSHGIGFHAQYDSWNQSNHGCPGPRRRNQIGVIIERLLEGDMDEADVARIARKVAWDVLAVTADKYAEQAVDVGLGIHAAVMGLARPDKDVRGKAYDAMKKAMAGGGDINVEAIIRKVTEDASARIIRKLGVP
jgi:hypothetical protein